MGYYINETSKGEALPPHGKVSALINDGALIVQPFFQPNLVCVVDNGFFEAAAYCHSEDEFKAFLVSDGRPKTWLIHPQAETLAK